VRYEILYRFGGIYFDADIQPIKEIDTGKLGHSFLVWESEIARPGLIASNIINLEKGHSLAKRMIEKLDGRSVPKDPLFLWIDTGPLLLTETYNNLHRPMRIMPSDMWEGKHFTGYGCSNPNAYTVCKQKYYEEVKHGI
jgi:mannosyltransferase OCH1-like enzyme